MDRNTKELIATHGPFAMMLAVGVLLASMLMFSIAAAQNQPETSRSDSRTVAAAESEFPSALENSFVNNCTGNGATEQYCGCVIDELSDELTLRQYKDLKSGDKIDSLSFRPVVHQVTQECV